LNSQNKNPPIFNKKETGTAAKLPIRPLNIMPHTTSYFVIE